MDELILKAQQQVNAILAQLERETGTIVERIDLHDLEVTNISDKRPQWQRTVHIELKRLPGTKWST